MTTNPKPRKQRVEEQKVIYDFIDMVEKAFAVMNFELGSSSDDIPKFTRHDGYSFSIPKGRHVKLHLKLEVEFTDEPGNQLGAKV